MAAALVACREAAALGLAGDVVVAAVADEEHASIGVREALESLSADAAIVTEPTEMELAVAHKGFVWLEIEVTGQAAHGSRPHLGVDAIVKSGPILTAHRAARPAAPGARAPAARRRLGARVPDRGRARALDLSRIAARSGWSGARCRGTRGRAWRARSPSCWPPATRTTPRWWWRAARCWCASRSRSPRDAPIVGIAEQHRRRGAGQRPADHRRELLGRLGLHRSSRASPPCCSVPAAREPMPWRSG